MVGTVSDGVKSWRRTRPQVGLARAWYAKRAAVSPSLLLKVVHVQEQRTQGLVTRSRNQYSIV